MIYITELSLTARPGLNVVKIKKWLSENIPKNKYNEIMDNFQREGWIMRDLLTVIYDYEPIHNTLFYKMCEDLEEDPEKVIKDSGLDRPELSNAEFFAGY